MADHDSTDDSSNIATAAQPVPMAAIPPNSAATKVFGVVELAEQILLELKTEDLFRAQRVCRQWKAVIESSSPCCKALFLEPGTAEDVNVGDVHRFVMEWWQRDFERVGIEELKHEGGIVFNPLLVRELAETPGEIFSRDALANPTWTSSLYPNLLNAGEEASCKRMFVSQPPLTFMTSSIEADCEPLPSPHMSDAMFAIAQLMWVPRQTIVVDAFDDSTPCRLGQGITLGELRGSLLQSLRDHQKVIPSALWTFAWANLRNVDTL